MAKEPVVAILGATGAVGQEFIRLIEERNFPYSKLKLLASARSAGKTLTVNGQEYTIEEAKPESFDGVDIGLFAGGSISKTLGPEAAKRGCIVIDNSSTVRMDPDVPLVVPEVNPEDIAWHKGIIANPNCSTIIMLMALKPIHDLSPIKKIIVSTYQAVSGAGKEGIDELQEETHDYTKEEMKMVNETHKMLHDDTIAITATTVRVPVFRSHAESIYVETQDELTVDAIRKAIDAFPGAQVQDNPAEMEYPMPMYTSEQYDCYVGRIRKDLYNPKAVNLWVSGDQIRKGAALNALQIAEYMLAHDMVK